MSLHPNFGMLEVVSKGELCIFVGDCGCNGTIFLGDDDFTFLPTLLLAEGEDDSEEEESGLSQLLIHLFLFNILFLSLEAFSGAVLFLMSISR